MPTTAQSAITQRLSIIHILINVQALHQLLDESGEDEGGSAVFRPPQVQAAGNRSDSDALALFDKVSRNWDPVRVGIIAERLAPK